MITGISCRICRRLSSSKRMSDENRVCSISIRFSDLWIHVSEGNFWCVHTIWFSEPTKIGSLKTDRVDMPLHTYAKSRGDWCKASKITASFSREEIFKSNWGNKITKISAWRWRSNFTISWLCHFLLDVFQFCVWYEGRQDFGGIILKNSKVSPRAPVGALMSVMAHSFGFLCSFIWTQLVLIPEFLFNIQNNRLKEDIVH